MMWRSNGLYVGVTHSYLLPNYLLNTRFSSHFILLPHCCTMSHIESKYCTFTKNKVQTIHFKVELCTNYSRIKHNIVCRYSTKIVLYSKPKHNLNRITLTYTKQATTVKIQIMASMKYTAWFILHMMSLLSKTWQFPKHSSQFE